MTTVKTPRDFTIVAIHNEFQHEANLLPVAELIINKRSRAQASRAASARKTSGRRRFVDPATCERDYTQAELEFMRAMQLYKQASGRSFPTWSEVLEVAVGLGYRKSEMKDAQV